MSFLDSLISKAFNGAPNPKPKENPFKATEAAPQVAVAAPVATPAPLPPMRQKAFMSGVSEPMNLSSQMDVGRIQSILRMAERGETWQLFALYRDVYFNYSHLQAEWGKRKQAIVGQKQTIIPRDKENPEDVKAAEVIQEMVDNCDNWRQFLLHILDATLYPVAVSEKVYEPVGISDNIRYKHPLRYRLKEIAPVNYNLLCFKAAYLNSINQGTDNEALTYNTKDWEPDLRLFNTDPSTGRVDYSVSNIYKLDPMRHVVHRGDIFGRSYRDNFGGQYRAILAWWLLATQDRDWWGLMMAKYGMPFIVAKADAQQEDTIAFLQNALALSSQIGGIVIDKNAVLELEQINATDGSNAHKILSDFANCEVSKLVIGQVLSSTPKNTGLGSGMADQAEGVREDIRQFDTTNLCDTLSKQVFDPYLALNGYSGKVLIAWGGIRPGDALMIAETASAFKNAGIQLSDKGLSAVSDKTGLEWERAPEPVETGGVTLGGAPKKKPAKKGDE